MGSISSHLQSLWESFLSSSAPFWGERRKSQGPHHRMWPDIGGNAGVERKSHLPKIAQWVSNFLPDWIAPDDSLSQPPTDAGRTWELVCYRTTMGNVYSSLNLQVAWQTLSLLGKRVSPFVAFGPSGHWWTRISLCGLILWCTKKIF